MTESQVIAIRTPFTLESILPAMRAAWTVEMGGIAPRRALAVLYAKFMMETSGSSCWNHNVGNIKHVNGDGFDWMVLSGNREGEDMHPVGPNESRFRSYSSFPEALRAQYRFLYAGRYQAAWNAAVTGSPEECAHLLRHPSDGGPGYYTGDEDDYAAGMRMNAAHFMASVPAWDETGPITFLPYVGDIVPSDEG